MIEFDDWDDSQQETEKSEYKLPDKVENIVVSHDGGRLSISINGKKVFFRSSGTRDCCVEINNE